jgi:hypothetical protein
MAARPSRERSRAPNGGAGRRRSPGHRLEAWGNLPTKAIADADADKAERQPMRKT